MSEPTPLFVGLDVHKDSILNLTTQDTIHVLNAPRSFEPHLAALRGVTVRRLLRGRTAFALAFVITNAELEAASTLLANAAEGDAVVWLAYPKGAALSPCRTDQDADAVREARRR